MEHLLSHVILKMVQILALLKVKIVLQIKKQHSHLHIMQLLMPCCKTCLHKTKIKEMRASLMMR